MTGSAISQWKNYSAQVTPFMPLLEAWVQRFGYE
jgi:hypothetical protein